MSRAGTGPRRTCVGCGRREAQATLSRLQVGPDGALHVVSRPAPGRSAYVHREAACVNALAKSRLLKRSLRRDVDAGRRAPATAELHAQAALAQPGECS